MLSRRPVTDADAGWVDERLTDGESALWHRLPVGDQRHSLMVAHRLVGDLGDPSREEVAAALLHDIGKLASGLGVWARVLATVVGPRTDRFRMYHDHESIGANMLTEVGADPTTVALVGGTSTDRRAADALRRADDI